MCWLRLSLKPTYGPAFRPTYTFFDKKNIDETNIRVYKQAERDEVLEYFPDETGY